MQTVSRLAYPLCIGGITILQKLLPCSLFCLRLRPVHEIQFFRCSCEGCV